MGFIEYMNKYKQETHLKLMIEDAEVQLLPHDDDRIALDYDENAFYINEKSVDGTYHLELERINKNFLLRRIFPNKVVIYVPRDLTYSLILDLYEVDFEMSKITCNSVSGKWNKCHFKLHDATIEQLVECNVKNTNFECNDLELKNYNLDFISSNVVFKDLSSVDGDINLDKSNLTIKDTKHNSLSTKARASTLLFKDSSINTLMTNGDQSTAKWIDFKSENLQIELNESTMDLVDTFTVELNITANKCTVSLKDTNYTNHQFNTNSTVVTID